MSKFGCFCGETLRISGYIPNPIESLLVSAATRATLSDADLLDSFYDRAIHAFICPVSAHVWMFWDGLLGPMTAYQLEGGDVDPAEAQEWDNLAREVLRPVERPCVGSVNRSVPSLTEGGLEQWWTISDLAFDGLPENTRLAELDRWLLPVRRCAAGDHLWVWWKGARQPPATYIAVGVTTDEEPPEAPVTTTERPSVIQRVLRWLSART